MSLELSLQTKDRNNVQNKSILLKLNGFIIFIIVYTHS